MFTNIHIGPIHSIAMVPIYRIFKVMKISIGIISNISLLLATKTSY